MIVLSVPDTLFLKDTDGDGKADVRKVLFTGWGTQRHARRAEQSALRLRQLDLRHRRLFGIPRHGRRRADAVQPGVLPVQAGRLEARVPPEHEQQLVGRELHRGRPALRLDGQRLPERLSADPEPILRVGARLVADASWPTSPARTSFIRSPRRSGRSTGTADSPPAAGHADLHSADLSASLLEPHRVRRRADRPPGRDVLAPAHGSDFSSENSWNLVASDDEWTSPIMAEVGPDGNVWMIDWYSFIVQHNPTPQGFQTGKGPPTSRRFATRRMGGSTGSSPRTENPRRRSISTRRTGRSSSRRLKSDNLFWRMHAQRLLVERGERDVVPELIKLVERQIRRRDRPEPGRDPRPVGTSRSRRLDGRRRSRRDGGLHGALQHPSAGVRRNAAPGSSSRCGTAAGRCCRRLLDDPRPAGTPRGLPGSRRDAADVTPPRSALAPRWSRGRAERTAGSATPSRPPRPRTPLRS